MAPPWATWTSRSALQALERLAHRVTVDAERLRQRALGGERLAGAEPALEDVLPQLVVDRVRHDLAADGGVGGSHVAVNLASGPTSG